MGLMDDVMGAAAGASAAASNMASTAKLKLELSDLGKQRQNFILQLGNTLYDRTKSDPAFTQGNEAIYDGINRIDERRIAVQAQIDAIEQASRRPAAPSRPMTVSPATAAVMQANARHAANMCPQCGAPMNPGDVFCMNCGHKRELPVAPIPSVPEPAAPSTRLCPNCGEPVEEDAVFCMECGTRLDVPAPEAIEMQEEGVFEPEPVEATEGVVPITLAGEAATDDAAISQPSDALASSDDPVRSPTDELQVSEAEPQAHLAAEQLYGFVSSHEAQPTFTDEEPSHISPDLPVAPAPTQDQPAFPSFCLNCGKPLTFGQAFCGHCGNKVVPL